MKHDAGNLSIDFLAGFTVFMLAFIWVATLTPGLLIGLTGNAIDYDAVAYRTGVILVEDPGMPANPPWENKADDQKDEVQRMGFSITKETPNLLTPVKIDRFFCSTAFVYPDDYQQKVIFGDHPYRFNISVRTFDGTINRSVGDIRPIGYGYIRRFVMVKVMSNATINAEIYNSTASNPTGYTNTTTHIFSIELNMTRLIQDEKRPAYQIDALREPIVINITNITALRNNLMEPSTGINLTSVRLWRINPTLPLAPVPPNQEVYIDGSPVKTTGGMVTSNISLRFPAGFFSAMATDQSKMFVNFTFVLTKDDQFLNSTSGNRPFQYDYDASRVTQPRLQPGIVEVAVW